MLKELDSSSAAALRSFTEAMQQAQVTLQREEQRLAEATHTLQTLQRSNAQLRDELVGNAEAQQRLDALRSEKLRLESGLRRDRDELARRSAHVQALRQPRLKLETRLQKAQQDLLEQRRHYVLRSAQVLGTLGQSLLPCHSVSALQQQRTAAEQERQRWQENVNELQAKRTAQEAALKALREQLAQFTRKDPSQRQHTTTTTTTTTTQQDKAGAEAAHDTQNDDTEAATTTTTSNQVKQQQQECTTTCGMASEGTTTTTTTTALCVSAMDTQETVAQLETTLQAARTTQQTRRAEQQAELQRLRARREQLKSEVKTLCTQVETADAAQQTQLQTLRHSIDAASSATTGDNCSSVLRCATCHADLIADFVSAAASAM